MHRGTDPTDGRLITSGVYDHARHELVMHTTRENLQRIHEIALQLRTKAVSR